MIAEVSPLVKIVIGKIGLLLLARDSVFPIMKHNPVSIFWVTNPHYNMDGLGNIIRV